MGLERQLQRWTAAGLLEPRQAERILAFEHQKRRPTLLFAVAGLGALAMAIGLVAIVAANWDVIPGRLKLALDLACVIGLSWAVLGWIERGRVWLREAGILVLYGLVLASIALLSQVYQLGGNAAAALGAWSALTLLLMAQARSAGVAVIWLIGLEATYAAGLLELAEAGSGLGDLALLASYWAPLLCLALGRSRWLQRASPCHANAWRAAGWAQLVLWGSLATLGFYERRGLEGSWLWGGVAVSLIGTLWLWSGSERSPAGAASRWLLVVAFAVAHLALAVPHGDWPVVAALAFIGLWGAVALAAHRAGQLALLRLATALIGLRLLLAYFEVFGSLLDTGLGLLSGGLLTLLMVWIWARKRQVFERELSGGAAPGEGSSR